MRLIDADSINFEGIVLNKSQMKSALDLLDNQATIKCAIYVGDTGFFDGCTKGYPYHYIDDKDRPEDLIVIDNDFVSTSHLLRNKFESVS